MSTCVVTGGAGFLGSHLCERLLTRDNRVICVDNLDTGSLQNIQHIRDNRFTFLNQDLTESPESRGSSDAQDAATRGCNWLLFGAARGCNIPDEEPVGSELQSRFAGLLVGRSKKG
jgi:nucleoside-diphosphate-sugar epimerase